MQLANLQDRKLKATAEVLYMLNTQQDTKLCRKWWCTGCMKRKTV
jgi:hypothetical protein